MSDDDLVCGVASVVEGTEEENGLDDGDADGATVAEAPAADGAGADE